MRTSVVLVVVLCAACGAEPDSADLAIAEESQALSPTLRSKLGRARAATARYHDVKVALADGFVPSGTCVELPDGAMGVHYVNFDRLLEPSLDVTKPEVLLYLPTRKGVRLIGIEYVSVLLVNGQPYFGCGVDNNSCPPPGTPPGPVLFEGAPFDGPMAGHEPQMPWHFDQHVWIWSRNPSGTFAQANPSLSCPSP
jgi:hypothetical protein